MASGQKNTEILIVDNDDNIVGLLTVNLKSEGYSVGRVLRASDVDRDNLEGTRLIIVDSMHDPDYNGLDLVSDLKGDPATENIGVILYSTYKSERMVIDVLEAGADDYVVKPFSLRELVARVKSVMRRRGQRAGEQNTAATLTFEGLTLDRQTQTVTLDGNAMPLTRTEFAILSLLMKNRSAYLSRADIFRQVWPEESGGGNQRIVDTNISRLRKKLGPWGEHISNVSGMGYIIM